jgi:TPR repeat protein
MHSGRVHRLPARGSWFPKLQDWITQGREQDALPWLLPYRRESWAQALLGEIRWKNPNTAHKAFRWFKRAAPWRDDGDPVVLLLAQCYAHGIGTPVNLFMARRVYLRAANALQIEALVALGDIEAQGLLIPINRVRAGSWYAVAVMLIKDAQYKEAIEDRMVELIWRLPREDFDRVFDDALQWWAEHSTE